MCIYCLRGPDVGYKSGGAHARLTLHPIEPKRRVNRTDSNSARCKIQRVFGALLLSLLGAGECGAQQIHLPKAPSGGIAEITAKGPQRRQGDVYLADDDVDIHYGEMRLQADHVEYNTATYEALARGHVQFDFENQHLEGDDAQLNIQTGHGTFHNVHGNVKLERHPNPTLLITENPVYFEAQEVERMSADVYFVRHSWFTICDPQHPTWQFYAPEAKITLQKSVALINSNFRLYRVPLLWLPYATTPAGERVRQTGFLIPVVGNSTTKGFTIGDAFYWAPTSWMDLTTGFEYFSRRGPSERVGFRARPFENTSIRYTYFGVQDRENQGGYQQQLEVQSLWNHGWRFVTDLNQLSSMTFRLAFGDTYEETISSDIRSSVFLTNNFHGYSLNIATLNDRSFLELSPANSVVLRSAPEARFNSVEQAPWSNLPFYFSFTSYAGALHRDDEFINTPNFVPRVEFAPRVTLPLHLGNWLGVTSSATFRTTYYGNSVNANDILTTNSILRNTGEFAVELSPPTLERYFDRPQTRHRYKHTVEPYVTYRYVTGVNNFAQFIRYDSDATLTNTNEIEYGITQRLWVKHGDDQPVDFLTWRLVQKHYFDPTFGGALITGQRNVFQALDSITAFAFASTPRNWSPIISDVTLTPGGKFDAEQILIYDTQLHKVTTIGTLLKIKPYREFYMTVADFRLQGDPIVEPPSNQIRAIIGYGGLTRQGFNVATGISYDILNSTLQNQFVMLNYNGGCCGLAVEYRRVDLGVVRTENQFRVALVVANIGTFGNLRRLDKVF